MDRLDALKTFIAVAEQSSFAEAARRLNISATTATRAVSVLEADLGVVLLRGTTRSVRLTDEGALYLERCRGALADLEDAAELVRGGTMEPSGSLVITAPVVFGRLHVLPIVAELVRAHPKLDVRLLLIDRVVRLVDEGVDVAVRIADLPDSALRALRVGEVRRVLSASPAYLEKHGEPRSAADLRDHALISFYGLPGPQGEWRFGPAGVPAVKISPRLTVNSVDAAIAAAKDGLGIVRTLSYQVAADVAAGRLRLLLNDLAPPPVPVHLVYQANRRASPNVRALLEAARRYFAAGIAG